MTEISYSAKQVAEALNISTAMLRRYALAYEEMTGEEIRQVKRDGRKYSQEQLETFLRAKAFVESDPNMTVVWGLKAAMGEVDAVSLPPVPEPRGSDPAAFVEALRAAVTAPLTEELRLLRRSNERLLERLEALEQRQLEAPNHDTLRAEATGATNQLTDPAADRLQGKGDVEQPKLFSESQPTEEAERSAELERMNAYLLGELERRRLAGEGEGLRNGRRWWQWWNRR